MASSVLTEPVKSLSDKKDYRLIQLPNKLRALLIRDATDLSGDDSTDSSFDSVSSDGSDIESEEETEDSGRRQAAAALCINVGSFSDPDDVPGLAHFLEHMVFMGSSKFPNENHFDMFIRRHGGSDNAHTCCERTVFQFEINPKYLQSALDIWAQFFIAPLLKISSIDREVKAVDSEFWMAQVEDDCRREQLVGSLCSSGHLVGKFTWGNLETLQTIPSSKSIKVYDALRKFHQSYYNANSMCLVVQSNEELDTLQQWVEGIFKNVPNNPKALQQKFTVNVPFPAGGSLPRLYKVVPVKNLKKLYLMWFLPPQHANYRVKPLHYISWLVGHEGKGSLMSLLKKKQLAFSLSAESDDGGITETSLYSMFTISISLTSLGCQLHMDVITHVFQYIHLLKSSGPNERIFNEIKNIEEIDFAYEEERPPLDNVEILCENLHLFPPEDVLSGDTLISKYNAGVIQDAVNSLTPYKCLMLFYDNFDKEEFSQKEPWFGTAYSSDPIDEEYLRRWGDGAHPHPDLHLPLPNPFIAEDFSLAPSHRSSDSVELLATDVPGARLWFKQDAIFSLPKAYIRLHLVNRHCLESPESQVHLELLVSILNHNLAEDAYDADAASLVYKISSSVAGGIVIKVSGYSDKLPVLLKTILRFFRDFDTTEEVLKDHKSLLRRDIHNKAIAPDALCRDIRLTILERQRFPLLDKRQAASAASLQSLRRFFASFVAGCGLDCLIQGNYSSSSALSIFRGAAAILSPPAAPPPPPRVLRLPRQPHLIKVRSLNPSDDNSMVTVYIQLGPGGVRESALLQLLAATMEEPCFDILRTKKQLGYSVFAQDHVTAGVLGLSVNVQTQNSRFGVEQVTRDILDFLDGEFPSLLGAMSEAEFSAQVGSLIAVKTQDDSHLGEEVDRHWDEVVSGDLLFRRIEEEVDCLRGIGLGDLKQFFNDACLENKRRLVVQVRGNSDATKRTAVDAEMEVLDEETPPLGMSRITDLVDFSSSNYYHPICRLLPRGQQNVSA